jgi:hypothetical protein
MQAGFQHQTSLGKPLFMPFTFPLGYDKNLQADVPELNPLLFIRKTNPKAACDL